MSEIKYTYEISELIENISKKEPIPFLWSGIKKGSFGFIFGPSKSGKTIICENLALALATRQKKFLGFELLEEDHKVLIISMEEYVLPRTERNKMQIEALKLDKDQEINLKVVGEEFPRFFATKDDWKILEETIVESQSKIVFIDSLTRMSAGDIEKSTYARDVSQQLRELTYDLGITMNVVHHAPKLDGKFLTLDSLAGSRVLAQEADSLIGINKSPHGRRYLKEVAFRYKKEDDENVIPFEINDQLWINPFKPVPEHQLFEGPDMRKDDTNEEYVRMIISQNLKDKDNPTFKSGEILKLVEGEMDRSTFYDKMKILQFKGEITKTDKGIYQYSNVSHT